MAQAAGPATPEPGPAVGEGGPGPSPVVVLMGVSGVGKTTVGRALAARLGWSFVDADALHPAANVAKMHRGEPLDDADRRPWLAAVHALVAEHRRTGTPLVLACSALKDDHRRAIVGDEADVRFVHLTASPGVIAGRLQRRHGHWMPASLLPSQLRDLQPPAGVPAVDVGAPVGEVVDRVMALVTR